MWYLNLLLDVNGVGGQARPGAGARGDGGAGAGAIEAGAGAAELETPGGSGARGGELPLTQHL